MHKHRFVNTESGSSLFAHFLIVFRLEVFLFLAFLIFFAGRSSSLVDRYSKSTSLIILKPSITLLNSPFVLSKSFASYVDNFFNVFDLNKRLIQENRDLRSYLVYLEKDAGENVALKKLLNFNKSEFGYISARLFLSSGFSFSSIAIVNIGSSSGVRENQVVVSGMGLVGRVFKVYNDSSHVVLLNDPNSRISVYSSDSRERAIMFGDYNNYPYLEYLTKNHSLKAGEVVYTSGDGGVFYPDIPVGVVVEEAGRYFVKPFVSLDALDFVSVITKKLL
jgi:rod shape-determining protein MreC